MAGPAAWPVNFYLNRVWTEEDPGNCYTHYFKQDSSNLNYYHKQFVSRPTNPSGSENLLLHGSVVRYSNYQDIFAKEGVVYGSQVDLSITLPFGSSSGLGFVETAGTTPACFGAASGWNCQSSLDDPSFTLAPTTMKLQFAQHPDIPLELVAEGEDLLAKAGAQAGSDSAPGKAFYQVSARDASGRVAEVKLHYRYIYRPQEDPRTDELPNLAINSEHTGHCNSANYTYALGLANLDTTLLLPGERKRFSAQVNTTLTGLRQKILPDGFLPPITLSHHSNTSIELERSGEPPVSRLPADDASLQVHKRIVARQVPDTAGVRYDASKDRKSTRLNSSHVTISYAVFCLKKKK